MVPSAVWVRLWYCVAGLDLSKDSRVLSRCQEALDVQNLLKSGPAPVELHLLS